MSKKKALRIKFIKVEKILRCTKLKSYNRTLVTVWLNQRT